MLLINMSSNERFIIKYKCKDSKANETEGNCMLESVTEFFKNLPPKICCDCGEVVEEQHECYGDQCDKCLGLTDIKN
jgi:hypothetical protein